MTTPTIRDRVHEILREQIKHGLAESYRPPSYYETPIHLEGTGYGTKAGARKALKTKGLKPRKKGGADIGGASMGGIGTKKGAKKNPWNKFLKAFRKANPHIPAHEMMQAASLVYHKL